VTTSIPPFPGNISFNAQHAPMGAFMSFTCGNFGTRGGIAAQLGKPAGQDLFIGIKEGGRFEKDLLPASDATVTLKGVAKPLSVRLLRDGTSLKSTYADGALTVDLPASKRSKTVDVVKIELPRSGR